MGGVKVDLFTYLCIAKGLRSPLKCILQHITNNCNEHDFSPDVNDVDDLISIPWLVGFH